MTPAQLEELKKLCAEATPGPWRSEVWHNHDDDGWAAVGPHIKDTPGDDFYSSEEPDSPSYDRATSDSDFIVAARTAVPELIAEVERLRGIIKEAERSGFFVQDDMAAPFDLSCPWCEACCLWGDKLAHADYCPAFTPDGGVK